MSLKLNALKITLWTIILCCSSTAYAQTALSLSSPEQAEIWRSLGKQASRISVSASLHVGEVVPDIMRLLAFASVCS
jgi:hypothetical protein